MSPNTDNVPFDWLAFVLLQHLIRGNDDEIYSFHNSKLVINGETFSITSPTLPEKEQKPRFKLLTERLGLANADSELLGKIWLYALSKGDVNKKRLLERGQQAILRHGEIEAPFTPWRMAVESRLYKACPQMNATVERLTPKQQLQREQPLELGPILTDWPKRLLNDIEWAYTEAPLPDVPPLPLDKVWVDVQFIEPLETGFLLQDESFLNALEHRYEESQWLALPAHFVIERLHGSAALIGAPGIGKTTLLKWLARHIVRQSEGAFLLPLFVPLRRYALEKKRQTGLDIIDFALKQCGITHPIQMQRWGNTLSHLSGLDTNTVLFLLDGWDEVPPESRESLLDEIRHLTHAFTILITSRPSAYPRALPVDKFYEITELSPESINVLVQRWFEVAGVSTQADTMMAHLDAYPDLGHLARNPFLLSLLCGITFQSSDNKTLPTSRTGLYQRTVEYITTHHSKRYPHWPFNAIRRRQVERLALWLLSEAPNAPRYVFDGQDVLTCCEDKELLPQILQPSRLLSQWDMHRESLHFLHTTFHEYLAAQGLQNSSQEQVQRLFEDRRHDLGWQEVFRFMAGSHIGVDHAFWQAIQQLATKPDRFGLIYVRLATFVAERYGRNGGFDLLGMDLRDKLWDCIYRGFHIHLFVDAYAQLDTEHYICRVQNVVSTLNNERLRMRFLRTLGRIRTPQASQALVDNILSGDVNVGAVATYAANRVLDNNGVKRLRDALDQDQYDLGLPIQKTIIRALGYAKDYTVTQRLATIARTVPDLFEDALRSLSRIGGNTAIQLLTEMLDKTNIRKQKALLIRALGDIREVGARDRLLEELALCSPEEAFAEEILNALSEMPISRNSEVIVTFIAPDKPERIRVAAAWALMEAMEQTAFRALVEAAEKDISEAVRIAALAALRLRARTFDVHWLQERVEDEHCNSLERANALEALLVAVAKHPAGRPDLWPYDGAGLRQVAMALTLKALAKPYPELSFTAASRSYLLGHDIAPRLTEICIDRTFPHNVREAACNSLGKLKYRESASVLLGLIEHAPSVPDDEEVPLTDLDEHLSRAAAEALINIDPGLALSRTEETIWNALANFAIKNGCLVFDEYILDTNGRVMAGHLPISNVERPGKDMKRILILASNPVDSSRLRLDEEIREIENGLQRAKFRENLTLKSSLATRSDDLRRAMLDFRPNIVHFSGHGSEEGIYLEDESGYAKPIVGEALANFIHFFAESVECVVLNACYSETQAQAIARYIPYVVGMKQSIADRAALKFSVGFYDALGAGESVKRAFSMGCIAIQLENLDEYDKPVLHKTD
jgi:HEAT repeat protein